MKQPHLILGIGELLWDIVADDMRLGGAPANFAVMSARLGNHAAILSRIGGDDLGRQAIERLDPMPVESGVLQVDSQHETGRVTVTLENGEPHYTIHEPAAWDFLELSDAWVQLAARADAICFGSLAQRNQQARQTIQALAAEASSTCIRVFDVNLRTPFYSAEVLEESLQLATVVKMNDTEAPLVLDLLDLAIEEAPGPGETLSTPVYLRAAAERLLAEFPSLQMVAATRGSRGSLLVTRDEWDEHSGFPVKVADGIGAGDAFTAAMTHYMLRGADLATLNEAGNRWGGWMASQSGAMPALPDAVRDAITAAIESTAE
ncbi:MAG: PfkB family carbohydrate kinase [Terracidiphilus sp.]|jgi:fructokinase